MMETKNLKHQDKQYQGVFNQRRTKQEIEECVVFARLDCTTGLCLVVQKRFKKN
jgi:hypothetical protein